MHIYYKMYILFFKKKSFDNFEIQHKHANFRLGVQYSLKLKWIKWLMNLYSKMYADVHDLP